MWAFGLWRLEVRGDGIRNWERGWGRERKKLRRANLRDLEGRGGKGKRIRRSEDYKVRPLRGLKD